MQAVYCCFCLHLDTGNYVRENSSSRMFQCIDLSASRGRFVKKKRGSKRNVGKLIEWISPIAQVSFFCNLSFLGMIISLFLSCTV